MRTADRQCQSPDTVGAPRPSGSPGAQGRTVGGPRSGPRPPGEPRTNPLHMDCHGGGHVLQVGLGQATIPGGSGRGTLMEHVSTAWADAAYEAAARQVGRWGTLD